MDESTLKRYTFARLYDPPMGDTKLEKILAAVSKVTGSKTLDYFFCGGVCGLSVSMTESKDPLLIANLFQAFLNRGYAMRTNVEPFVYFPPHSYYGGCLYQCRYMHALLSTIAVCGRKYYHSDAFRPERWSTPHAKNKIYQLNHCTDDDKPDLRCPLFCKEAQMLSRRRHRKHGKNIWNDKDEAEYRELEQKIRDTYIDGAVCNHFEGTCLCVSSEGRQTCAAHEY